VHRIVTEIGAVKALGNSLCSWRLLRIGFLLAWTAIAPFSPLAQLLGGTLGPV
jgi:hypothetical protein